MLRKLCLMAGFLAFWFCQAQEMPLDYRFGEKYKDRYKYSNLLSFSETISGEKVLVRAYYTGILLRPKGYLIERYNPQLELIDEYNYRFRDADFVHGFIANGQIYLLFLTYDQEQLAYEYTVHQSPLGTYNFSVQTLLTVPADPVANTGTRPARRRGPLTVQPGRWSSSTRSACSASTAGSPSICCASVSSGTAMRRRGQSSPHAGISTTSWYAEIPLGLRARSDSGDPTEVCYRAHTREVELFQFSEE